MQNMQLYAKYAKYAIEGLIQYIKSSTWPCVLSSWNSLGREVGPHRPPFHPPRRRGGGCCGCCGCACCAPAPQTCCAPAPRTCCAQAPRACCAPAPRTCCAPAPVGRRLIVLCKKGHQNRSSMVVEEEESVYLSC